MVIPYKSSFWLPLLHDAVLRATMMALYTVWMMVWHTIGLCPNLLLTSLSKSSGGQQPLVNLDPIEDMGGHKEWRRLKWICTEH